MAFGANTVMIYGAFFQPGQDFCCFVAQPTGAVVDPPPSAVRGRVDQSRQVVCIVSLFSTKFTGGCYSWGMAQFMQVIRRVSQVRRVSVKPWLSIVL